MAWCLGILSPYQTHGPGSATGSWRDGGPARRELEEVRLPRVALYASSGNRSELRPGNVGHTIMLMTDEDVSRPCSGSGSYCIMNRELLELNVSNTHFRRLFYGHTRTTKTLHYVASKKEANNPDGRQLQWHKAKCSHLERAFSFLRLFLQLSRPGQFSLVMSVMLV